MIGNREGLSSDQLEILIARLAPYDRLDLVAGVGALQLMPENADRLLRLEAVASLIATSAGSDGDDRPCLGAKRWKDLVNGPPVSVSSLCSDEDPLDTLFVDQVTFTGGSHLILPGLFQDAVFIVRQLLRCVLLAPDPFPDAEFADFVRRVSGLVLSIGDLVIRRGGLGRGIKAIHRTERQVVIPTHETFNMLKRAVTLDAGDIREILGWVGASCEDLNRLIMTGDSESVGSAGLSQLPILRAPLVQIAGYVIVAAPAALLGALRHLIVSEATARGLAEELAIRYRLAVADAVNEALENLKCGQLALEPPNANDEALRPGWFSLDRDKLLHVVVVTDPLTAYDPFEPYGVWAVGGLGDRLRAHLVEAASQVGTLGPGAVEVLYLVIVQGIGRHFQLASRHDISPQGSTLLVMRAAELEVIGLVERGHRLTLRQYAEARRRFHAHVDVMTIDELDEFAFYQARDHSYYASDEARPTGVVFSPGLSETLHHEIWRRYDFHGVTWADGHSGVEVVLAHDDVGIPIYTRRDFPRIVNWLVEGLPINVWVLGPDSISDSRMLARHFEMAELVAYWIWQCSPGLNDPLHVVAGDVDLLRLRISLHPDERWIETREDALPAQINMQDVPIKCEIISYEEVAIEFDASLLESMARPDNAVEREVVREILRAIGDWLVRNDVVLPQECESWVSEIVERHAPLGLKKKVVTIGGDQALRMRTDDLPFRRTVQAAEEASILDEVGNYSGLPDP